MQQHSKTMENRRGEILKAVSFCLIASILSGCAIGSPLWNATIEPLTGIHAAESQEELNANRAQRNASARERALAYRELQNSQARAEADFLRAKKQASICVIHFQNNRNEAVAPSDVRIVQDSYHENFGSGNDFKFSASDISSGKPLEICYVWNGGRHVKNVYANAGTGIIKVIVD